MRHEYVVDVRESIPRPLHYRMHAPVAASKVLTRCGERIGGYAIASVDRETAERLLGPTAPCAECGVPSV